MSEDFLQTLETNNRAAADALRMAFAHLYLRNTGSTLGRKRPDLRVTEEMSEREFMIEMARRVADWVGQPEKCGNAKCRRAKLCEGMPPECWRDEKSTTHQEEELARNLLRYHLDRAAEMDRGKEPVFRSPTPSSPRPAKRGEGARA